MVPGAKEYRGAGVVPSFLCDAPAGPGPCRNQRNSGRGLPRGRQAAARIAVGPRLFTALAKTGQTRRRPALDVLEMTKPGLTGPLFLEEVSKRKPDATYRGYNRTSDDKRRPC